MELCFTFLPEDYRHFLDFFAKRRRSRRKQALLASLLLVSYVVLLQEFRLPLAFAVIISAVLTAACIALLHWRSQRRMLRVSGQFLGDRTIRISPDGIFGRFPHSEVLTRWSGVTEIVEDDHCLCLLTGNSGAYVIPKRIFPNPSDLDKFREGARSYWASSPHLAAQNSAPSIIPS